MYQGGSGHRTTASVVAVRSHIPLGQILSVGRRLKKVPSGVLGSEKSSTYPRGYASGFFSAAALLDDLFEHPRTITYELWLNEPGVIKRRGLGWPWCHSHGLSPRACDEAQNAGSPTTGERDGAD